MAKSDHDAILETLYRFTQAQDRLDLAEMVSLMKPDVNIKFDLTKHFPEVGVLQGSAKEICNILYEASAGWTATQHPVYNPVITWSSSKVSVQAMVQAYHCLEMNGVVEALTVRAAWKVEMEQVGGKWLMTDLAMIRDIPLDNPGLFEKMKANVEAGHQRKPVTSA